MPHDPSSVNLTILNISSIFVIWEEPRNMTASTCDITKYTVSWSSAELPVSALGEASTDGTNYTIAGLTAKTEYNVTVMATTSEGDGEPSLGITATTHCLCKTNMAML